MATVLENLVSAREGAAAKLAAALANDYTTEDELIPDLSGSGPSLNRTAYVRELRDTIKYLDEEINRHSPYEITSEMTV